MRRPGSARPRTPPRIIHQTSRLWGKSSGSARRPSSYSSGTNVEKLFQMPLSLSVSKGRCATARVTVVPSRSRSTIRRSPVSRAGQGACCPHYSGGPPAPSGGATTDGQPSLAGARRTARPSAPTRCDSVNLVHREDDARDGGLALGLQGDDAEALVGGAGRDHDVEDV